MKPALRTVLMTLMFQLAMPSFGDQAGKASDLSGRWVGCFGYVGYQLTLDHGHFDFDYFDDGGGSYKKSGSFSVKGNRVRLHGEWRDHNDEWIWDDGKLWRADAMDRKGNGRRLVLQRPMAGCQ